MPRRNLIQLQLRRAARYVRYLLRRARRLSTVETPSKVETPYDELLRMYSYVVQAYGYKDGLPEVSLLEFNALRDEVIHPYSYLEGQAMPTDIALLKGLAQKRPNCQYFEFGSWRGESLVNVASVAKQCFSLSLGVEEMQKNGMTESFIAQHHFFSRDLPNVAFLAHNSHTFDFTPYKGTCDVVFIDADHSRQGVMLDTQNALNLLKDEHSVIVWHDYGVTTERVNWTVLAGILDGIPRALHHHLYHVSHTICAIYSRQAHSAHFHTFPELPEIVFDVRLSARPLETNGSSTEATDGRSFERETAADTSTEQASS